MKWINDPNVETMMSSGRYDIDLYYCRQKREYIWGWCYDEGPWTECRDQGECIRQVNRHRRHLWWQAIKRFFRS